MKNENEAPADLQQLKALALAATGSFTQEQIVTAARALADRNATLCNVNKDDNWKIYGEEFITDARVALDAIAALCTQDAGAEGAE